MKIYIRLMLGFCSLLMLYTFLPGAEQPLETAAATSSTITTPNKTLPPQLTIKNLSATAVNITLSKPGKPEIAITLQKEGQFSVPVANIQSIKASSHGSVVGYFGSPATKPLTPQDRQKNIVAFIDYQAGSSWLLRSGGTWTITIQDEKSSERAEYEQRKNLLQTQLKNFLLQESIVKDMAKADFLSKVWAFFPYAANKIMEHDSVYPFNILRLEKSDSVPGGSGYTNINYVYQREMENLVIEGIEQLSDVTIAFAVSDLIAEAIEMIHKGEATNTTAITLPLDFYHPQENDPEIILMKIASNINPGIDLIYTAILKCISLLPREKNPLQAMIVPDDSRIFTVGDVHGSYNTLAVLLQKMREQGLFKIEKSFELQDNCYLVFTGDLIDRGPNSLGSIMLAIFLKNINPRKVFICQGNHEDASIASQYGFFGSTGGSVGELERKFGRRSKFLTGLFSQFFEHLPLAVLFGTRKSTAKLISYGMFNHGSLHLALKNWQSVEPNLASSIASLLQEVRNKPIGTIITLNYPLDAKNGLNWGDYDSAQYNDNDFSDAALETRDTRGTGLRICTLKDVTIFAQLIHQYDPFSELSFIARGHQHADGGVLKLRQPYIPINYINYGFNILWQPQEIAPSASFTQLPNTHIEVIENPSVFMFMSMNEAYPFSASWSCGFGIFKMNADGHWELIPFVIQNKELQEQINKQQKERQEQLNNLEEAEWTHVE